MTDVKLLEAQIESLKEALFFEGGPEMAELRLEEDIEQRERMMWDIRHAQINGDLPKVLLTEQVAEGIGINQADAGHDMILLARDYLWSARHHARQGSDMQKSKCVVMAAQLTMAAINATRGLIAVERTKEADLRAHLAR